MKDSKEKEHRISNLKDMVNNIKEDQADANIEDFEEDSELISYLNENDESYEELEIDDEFLYHPGDDKGSEVSLEDNAIDEKFMVKAGKEDESDGDSEESDEELSNEITENFDNILNAKIGRTPVIGLVSTLLGLIFIVIAAITFQSRSDKIVDNVISGETTFIVVIFLIIGLLLFIYGIFKVIGLRNPLSNISRSIDSIEQGDKDANLEEIDENIIPKSNIPLDKESYKIGEFDFNEIKNKLKKTKTNSKPKATPVVENIDDIPPAREKPDDRKGLTPQEIEEIEYNQAVLDNESIDDIFAEVEEIEDLPIISIDSEEENKK